jgi:hypothetical protein
MKHAIFLRRYSLFWGCAAAALMAPAGCGWTPWSHSSLRPAGAVFADDALADYLPADAGAVYTLDVRRTLESPAGRRVVGPLRLFLDKEKGNHPWIDDLGADPVNDIDWAQFLFCPPDLDHPLVLLRGRLDAARLSVGPGKLGETSDGPFTFFELPGRATSLARAGDTVAVCDSRPRFLAALNYAVAPRPVVLQDARLRELLRQVDRKQSVWLAVSFDKLGPVPRLADFGLETVLRPVLRYAESVRGGVTVGEDVRGEFVFRARTDADAGELDQDLTASCTVAQGAYLIPGLDPSLLPLLEFMGTGATSRDGREITLRCRLPAERIAP